MIETRDQLLGASCYLSLAESLLGIDGDINQKNLKLARLFLENAQRGVSALYHADGLGFHSILDVENELASLERLAFVLDKTGDTRAKDNLTSQYSELAREIGKQNSKRA